MRGWHQLAEETGYALARAVQGREERLRDLLNQVDGSQDGSDDGATTTAKHTVIRKGSGKIGVRLALEGFAYHAALE
jgi:hypothetical protein